MRIGGEDEEIRECADGFERAGCWVVVVELTL